MQKKRRKIYEVLLLIGAIEDGESFLSETKEKIIEMITDDLELKDMVQNLLDNKDVDRLLEINNQ